MCDQQSLRSACACAQSNQSLCLSLEYTMSDKILTEHHLEFLSFTGGCTGSSKSTLAKCYIVGNHVSRLIFVLALSISLIESLEYGFISQLSTTIAIKIYQSTLYKLCNTGFISPSCAILAKWDILVCLIRASSLQNLSSGFLTKPD